MELLNAPKGDDPIGTDPVTGLPVYAKSGRFGPYVQLGNGEKPQRSGIPKGYSPETMDLEKARQEICVPTFMLKILPSYEKRPRICELVRTEITNISVKGAWRGPARLQLFEHVLAPLADLPVREIISATHILTDLTLSPATVIYDYLTDSAPSTSSKKK